MKDLSNEDLVIPCELLAIEIGKLQKRLYEILGRQTWVPQHEKNKVFQPLDNQRMFGLPPKP
jgi:hypothetical protein